MALIVSFRDLDAWRLSMDLAVMVHRLAIGLPAHERFALGAQVRRAAVSVPSNVAEGHSRETRTYRHHVRIAIGSLAELETQVELIRRFDYAEDAAFVPILALIARVGQVLHGLDRTLRRRSQPPDSANPR